jgi:hypothetical protein
MSAFANTGYAVAYGRGSYVPILLQKSAIITAKRLTAIFQALVAVCSIGSRLYAVALTPAAVTQHAQWLVLVAVGRPVWRGAVGFVRLRRA